MSRAREFENSHLQFGKEKEHQHCCWFTFKIEWDSMKQTDKRAIPNFKNKRTNSNPLYVMPYQIIMFTQYRWFILMRYDAMRCNPLHCYRLARLKQSATNWQWILHVDWSMPIMLKIYLNGYLHFRHADIHTCDLIKLIRIAIPLEWVSMHITHMLSCALCTLPKQNKFCRHHEIINFN